MASSLSQSVWMTMRSTAPPDTRQMPADSLLMETMASLRRRMSSAPWFSAMLDSASSSTLTALLRALTSAAVLDTSSSRPLPVTADTEKNGRPSFSASSRRRLTASSAPGMSHLFATTICGRSASSAAYASSSWLMAR